MTLRRLAPLLLALSLPARAAETTVLPRGVFLLDVGYLDTQLDKQWNGQRKATPLVDEMRRFEPGGGLQGVLHANPLVRFQILVFSLMYGVTDRLSLQLVAPLVLRTTIDTRLTWTPGDYQGQLGRPYSEDDFWQWAASMGQPRLASRWVGNQFTFSDLVLGGRYLLPQSEWMATHHLRWAAALQAALPTGTNADPEEPVSAGTNLWELHAAGDVEAHLSADQALLVNDDGLARVSVGADVFGSYFRPRTYQAGHGTRNPLLTNTAPYVGDTYTLTPGSWLGAGVSVDVVPFIGPSRASVVSGGDAAKAARLPPLVLLTLGYTFVATGQSDWHSLSPLWDWDREQRWQAGEKHLFKAVLTVSLLRVGLPLQVYASYRTQDLIPGRFTRPSSVFSVGVRALASFW